MKRGKGVLSQIIDGSPVPTFVIDTEHRITHWNVACENITGVSALEMLGSRDAGKAFYGYDRPCMADLMVNGDFAEVQKLYEGKFHKSEVLEDAWEADDFFPTLPGGGKWLSFSASVLRNEFGQVIGAIETLRDITKQKEYEQSLKDNQQLLSEVIEGCPVPMFVIDKEHTVTHWNKACESIIGTPAEDIVGTKDQWKAFYEDQRPVLADLVLENKLSELSQYYEGIWAASPLIEDGWEATDHFPNFQSGEKWLYFTAAPLHGENGEVLGAVETLQDVSEQKEYQAKLEFQANHDALTGIANRNLLSDRLSQAIAHAERDDRLIAVLFMDLDNFKTVNDTLGHNVGDHLIFQTAQKIQDAIRSGDTVARLGGDEFVVMLFAPENEDHVTDIVRRIMKEVSTTYTHDGHDIHVGCSIGIAMYPQDGSDVETLMKNADSAMYRAKAREKGGFRFFTQDLTERAFARLQMENDLRKAIESDQFELVYQPIYKVETETIIAAEALLRWKHPLQGVVSPVEFIPIAEETGLIVPIGDWVLQTAAKEAMYWKDVLGRNVRCSVNVSARQFRNDEIHNALERVYRDIGRAAIDLELEITENIVMSDPEKASVSLNKLRDLGAHLAMDDFGTGYSSMAYLRRFPFDMIKIDKAFVDDIGHNLEAQAVVRAMLDLGKALGLRMLAEGVETEVQYRFLRDEGCDEVQGYYFSKPISRDEFRCLISEQAVDETGKFIGADI